MYIEFEDVLGDSVCLIRTMPNTPAMIGEGITVWTKTSSVSEEQHNLAQAILGSFGEEVGILLID